MVAGREDGTLVQYDPDLKEKKKWDYPTILTDDSYQGERLKLFHNRSFYIYNVSRAMRKPDFCLCKNKGADQLCSYYTESTVTLLLKSEISSF